MPLWPLLFFLLQFLESESALRLLIFLIVLAGLITVVAAHIYSSGCSLDVLQCIK